MNVNQVPQKVALQGLGSDRILINHFGAIHMTEDLPTIAEDQLHFDLRFTHDHIALDDRSTRDLDRDRTAPRPAGPLHLDHDVALDDGTIEKLDVSVDRLHVLRDVRADHCNRTVDTGYTTRDAGTRSKLDLAVDGLDVAVDDDALSDVDPAVDRTQILDLGAVTNTDPTVNGGARSLNLAVLPDRDPTIDRFQGTRPALAIRDDDIRVNAGVTPGQNKDSYD